MFKLGESSLNLTEKVLICRVGIRLRRHWRSSSIPGASASAAARLSLKYVLLLWIGLACDTTGTSTAGNIASQSGLRLRHPCHHGRRGHRAHAGACALGYLHLWLSQQARRRFTPSAPWYGWRGSCLYHWHARGHPAIHLPGRVRYQQRHHHVAILAVILFAKDARRMIAAERVAGTSPTRFRTSDRVGKIAPLRPYRMRIPKQGPPAKMPGVPRFLGMSLGVPPLLLLGAPRR